MFLHRKCAFAKSDNGEGVMTGSLFRREAVRVRYIA